VVCTFIGSKKRGRGYNRIS